MKINNGRVRASIVMVKGERTWRSRISCCCLSANLMRRRLPRSTNAWRWPRISVPWVTAVAVEEDILVRPKVMISAEFDNAATAEAVRSVSNAHGLLEAFDAAAIRFDVRNERWLQGFAAADIPANLAVWARLKDLSLVPVKPHDDQSEKIVERLIFESGRPILMCPEEFAGELAVAFDQVVIAWDHTAPAARAVADALPILQAAASVRIITATDDNTPAELESGAALVSHLAEHSIEAT